jgi:hypothetical protein
MNDFPVLGESSSEYQVSPVSKAGTLSTFNRSYYGPPVHLVASDIAAQA